MDELETIAPEAVEAVEAPAEAEVAPVAEEIV